MSKITLTINLGNGHEITFSSNLGPDATPFEIVNTLDAYIIPSAVRALGLRTTEEEAALNAEAVDRANAIVEAATGADKGDPAETGPGAPGDVLGAEGGDPYRPADLGEIDPETATADEVELIASADGETRIKPRPGPTANK